MVDGESRVASTLRCARSHRPLYSPDSVEGRWKGRDVGLAKGREGQQAEETQLNQKHVFQNKNGCGHFCD